MDGRPARGSDLTSRIAVIGLGALFPGAPDVRTYWSNIRSGRDCIGELPESRMDSAFVDPTSRAVDRIPHRRAGVLGASVRFEAIHHGIMPVAARGAEPDQLLALAVASAALADAGLLDVDFDRRRAGVILGRGAYLTPGLVQLNRKVRVAEELVGVLRELLPGLDAGRLNEIKARFQEQAGTFGPDTAIGLVPNLTASRIANRLDLQGPAYTLDGACASALLAVEHGVNGLRHGQLDLALVGGVHVTHDIAFHSVFAQLGAVSPSGQIRPFDRRADGLVVGEGIGMLVLMRLDDAERGGHRIYATLDGVGSSSDGRASSAMAPRVEGQLLAVQRAWADAGREPDVGLIEAHGTGTQAGDTAELTTLHQVFGKAGVIGSVKSQIGHTMPAAGAAGLIKAVLAVYHGELPPSLHCEEPHAMLQAWRVLAKAEPWEGPRSAGVNAFGFGGINAHVIVGAHGDAVPLVAPARRPSDRDGVEVLALAAASPEALLDALARGERRGGEGPCRLALVDPTEDRLDMARKIVERGTPWSGRRGFWYRPEGLLHHGELVFLYPGIEAEFSPQVVALAAHFGLPEPAFMQPADLEQTGRGVVGLARFLTTILERVGVVPQRIAGHSIGEWSAMLTAGVLDGDEVDAFLDRVPLGGLEVPGVSFLAAGCGRELAEGAIVGLDRIAISHDNCPHQVILCGEEEPIQAARTQLMAAGVVCQILPFKSGFHSPLFADYLGPHQRHFAELTIRPPRLPLYSATLAEQFPNDVDALRQTALDHLVQPLRWTPMIRKLHDDGARVFVQVGTGSLPGFVGDTLGDRPHTVLSLLEPRRDGLVQLRNLLLGLFVEGLDVLEALIPKPAPTMELQLGTPLVHLDLAPLTAVPAPTQGRLSSPLQAAFERTMTELQRGPLEVLAALAPQELVQQRLLSVHTDPLLRDHSFFPQPAGWTVISDGRPVVPMTMMIDLLREIALELAPDQVVTRIENLTALQWLVVEPPVTVTLRARKDKGAIHAEIEGYASATIHTAPKFTRGEPELVPLRKPAPPSIDAVRLYSERWMFHGPAYQGITDLGTFDETGVDGVITVPAGQGSLLDNAGQLLGWWLMASADLDQLAMPVGMRRLDFYGPDPGVGAAVHCRVRISDLTERALVADLELLHEGRLWCRIQRWADHRFTTDRRVWDVMRQPEHSILATPMGPFWYLEDRTLRAPSRDWLMRRYLTESERNAMQQSRQARQFLNDRIVVSDARRSRAWARGSGPLFPVETPTDGHCAVAHHGAVSVAIASDRPVAIGIDPDPKKAIAAARAVAGNVEQVEFDGLTIAWVRQG